ncbi:MAG: universal stress protein, partial [Kiloniellales bacterium]
LSRRPVIMANALPVGAYDRILVATDLSDCSALAIEAARRLGLLDSADVVALHAFDAPAQGMMLRASTTTQQLKNYLADQEEHAGAELEAFLNRLAFKPRERIVRLIETSAAETIRECVRQGRVDLVVLGTRGRSGMARLFLGSVAEDVLRNAEIDVLAVPPGRGAAASPSP